MNGDTRQSVSPEGAQDEPLGPVPVTVCLADVMPEPLQWLWPGRVPLGKLTLIAGDPGLGKSFLTLDMAARVSSGTPWPDLRDQEDPIGSVVLLSAEDDLSDTIRPRLDAAGADVSRVVALKGVLLPESAGVTHFSLAADIPQLEETILQVEDVRLVVIDPVTAYLGRADGHKNAEIRGLLAPLAELASAHRVAVVCITHLNKAAGTKALYRAMGSLAFAAAARAVWLVTRDKDDPLRRLMLPAKMNLAPEVTGLAYKLVDGVVAWEPEPVQMTADDALVAELADAGDQTERQEAADWLREVLADGSLAMKDVQKAAREAGHSWATVRRAKGPAGVEVRKEGFGADGRWVWGLRCSPDPKGAQQKEVSALAEREHLSGTKDSPPGVPAGWTAEDWRDRLLQVADRCESDHPDAAADYRHQAAALGNDTDDTQDEKPRIGS